MLRAITQRRVVARPATPIRRMSEVTSPSPFATHLPGRLVIPGVPIPTMIRDKGEKERLVTEVLPRRSEEVVTGIETAQASMWTRFADFDVLRGRHVLLAGGTSGLGASLAAAFLKVLGNKGSLTIVAADRDNPGFGEDIVLPYHVGIKLHERSLFMDASQRPQVNLINTGTATEGDSFEALIHALSGSGANNLLYINMVAAASSGLMRGPDGVLPPPVFVRDILTAQNSRFVPEAVRSSQPTDAGQAHLIYWAPPELTQKQIDTTKLLMGTMAIGLPAALRARGIAVDQENYAGWRGSLDTKSRVPANVEYGRQGTYSTSLFLPKDVIEAYVDGGSHVGQVMNHFFPVMRTRALGLIPGGPAIAGIYEHLMRKQGIAHVGVPELALMMLNTMGEALRTGSVANPHPRHDSHEIGLDHEAQTIMANLSDESGSPHHISNYVN